MQTFIARQPIFDQRQRVYAYELLYRSGPENVCTTPDLDHAAAKVVVDSLGSDKPAELVVEAAVRARFCEALAPLAGLGRRAEDLFLAGQLGIPDADAPTLYRAALDWAQQAFPLAAPAR